MQDLAIALKVSNQSVVIRMNHNTAVTTIYAHTNTGTQMLCRNPVFLPDD